MILDTVENLLNRNLARSPRARELCAELAGRSVAIDVQGLRRIVVSSDGRSVRVAHPAAPGGAQAGAADAPETPAEAGAAHAPGGAADAVLTGGPFSMLALAGAGARAVLQRGDVRIDGDVELAQRFRELALLLAPDLEEELATLVGDAPAHRLGRMAGTAFDWLRHAADTAFRNAGEYLAHERRDLVPAAEAQVLFEGADSLREDVDRLEARIALLERRIAPRRAEG